MRFSTYALLDQPAVAVYRACRDELTDVARDLVNIERIEQRSRADMPGRTRITNVWHGRGWIPKIAREVVAPEMIVCDAYVTWHDAEQRCDWEIETRFLTECVRCTGQITFRSCGRERTRLTMSGDLTLDVSTVSAVPRLLRGFVARQSERFLLAMVPGNVRGVAQAFDLHLRSREAALAS